VLLFCPPRLPHSFESWYCELGLLGIRDAPVTI